MAPLKVTLHVYDLQVNLESAVFAFDNTFQNNGERNQVGGTRQRLVARTASISALQQFFVRYLGYGLSLAVRATNRVGMAVGWGGLLHTGVSVDWRHSSSSSGNAASSSTVEFGFGACSGEGSGVYECKPGCNPQFHHACTISLGETPLEVAQVRAMVAELAATWPCHRYHLLHRNCHHFTAALCEALQVQPPPPWCNCLARIGAKVAVVTAQVSAELSVLFVSGKGVEIDCGSLGNIHRLNVGHHSCESVRRRSNGSEDDCSTNSKSSCGALGSGQPATPTPCLAACRRLVFAAAIVSRLLTCFGLLVADWFLPEALVASPDAKTFGTASRASCVSRKSEGSDCCDSGGCSDIAVECEEKGEAMRWPQGGARWDGAHFLSIARDGYGYGGYAYNSRDNFFSNSSCNYDGTYDERSFAFFPLYPALVRVVAFSLNSVATFATAPFTTMVHAEGQGDWVYVVSGLLVSNVCFVGAALVLLELGFVVLGRPTLAKGVSSMKAVAVTSEHGQRLACVGALAFCVSPAGPFFSAAYSESLFSLLTFSGLFLLSSETYPPHNDDGSCIISTWYYFPWLATCLLAAAAGARSIGALAVVFLAADSWRRAWAAAESTTVEGKGATEVAAATELSNLRPDPPVVPQTSHSSSRHEQTSERSLHHTSSTRPLSKRWVFSFALQVALRAPGLCLRCSVVALPSLLHDVATAASLCAAASRDNAVVNATAVCHVAEICSEVAVGAATTVDSSLPGSSSYFPRAPLPMNFCGHTLSKIPPPPPPPLSSYLSLWAPASNGSSPSTFVTKMSAVAVQKRFIDTFESSKEQVTWWVGAMKWWWKAGMPSGYRHLQRSHWDVGLFQYWQLKQLPNFVLAAPMLIFTAAGLAFCGNPLWHFCWSAAVHSKMLISPQLSFRRFFILRRNRHPLCCIELWPYFAQWLILAVTAFALANVQVVTRLIGAACPLFYWTLGEVFVGECALPLYDSQDDDGDGDDDDHGQFNDKILIIAGDAHNANTDHAEARKAKDNGAAADSDDEYIGRLTKDGGCRGRSACKTNSNSSDKKSTHALSENRAPTDKQPNASTLLLSLQLPELKPWVLAWVITFNVVGTFLHSNGLPWT